MTIKQEVLKEMDKPDILNDVLEKTIDRTLSKVSEVIDELPDGYEINKKELKQKLGLAKWKIIL